MDEVGELAIGLIIVVALFGIVVPILPGLILEVVAILIWALLEGGTVAWAVAITAVLLAGLGTFVKYSVPKRRLNEAGVPTRTLVLATVVAIIGLFVVPVIGAPIGFVATIYVFERLRVGSEHAWPATKASLGAMAASIGIELTTGLIIAGIWMWAVILA